MSLTWCDDVIFNDQLKCLYKMQNDRFEIFKQQDLEKGQFDVTFEVGGKLLHAHKFVLTSVSEPLDAWLSGRWTAKDEVIKIENYPYDCFYQFLCFLYISNCELTEANVFKMVDMAEFYGTGCLKEFCDKFLSSKMEYTVENIEEMFEFAGRYFLPKFIDSLKRFICIRSEKVYNYDGFNGFKKTFIECLVKIDPDVYCSWYKYYDLVFDRVYKWAENHVLKQKAFDDQNFNLLEAVKTELSTILPFIKFPKMSSGFLMDFVIEKGFLLSPLQLSEFFLYGNLTNIEQSVFKKVCDVAEKQALYYQKMNPTDESFNLANVTRAYLVDIIPHVKFYWMEKTFLMDFVVPKGIISEEQANHVSYTRVQIENNGKSVVGIFDDFGIGILYAIERRKSCHVKRKNTNMVRFLQLKFDLPSTPSTVIKSTDIDWYLCLEPDRTLAFKNYASISDNDYLLAEMKSRDKFQLTPGATTFLTARINNI